MKFAPKKMKEAAAPAAEDTTVVPSADGAPEGSTGGPSDPVESTEAPTRTLVLSSRRLGIIAAVSCATLVATFAAGQRMSSPSGSPFGAPADSMTAPTVSSVELVSSALRSAQVYATKHGTFVGFAYTGTKVASSSTMLLVSSVVDGVCAFSKIVEGTVYEVGLDETLETCNPATIEAAQAMLDEYEAANTTASASEFSAVLISVADAAVRWAAMSFDAFNRPSLYGLQDLQIPGTKVLSVADDGQSAKVQVLSNGKCAVAVVSAQAGSTPATLPC